MFTELGLALPKALGCSRNTVPNAGGLPAAHHNGHPGTRLQTVILATGAAGSLLSRPSSQGPRHMPTPHAPPLQDLGHITGPSCTLVSPPPHGRMGRPHGVGRVRMAAWGNAGRAAGIHKASAEPDVGT